jgi:hypothetical protein
LGALAETVPEQNLGTAASDREGKRLRRWNVVVGVAHLAQAILILALSTGVSLPVTSSYMTGPPASGMRSEVETLFEVPFGPAVAAFLLLAAIDHLLMAAPGIRSWYERNVRRGVNPARWWEYSVSASLMAVLIAMLTGIEEITALIAIFGANAGMILFGLVMERVNVGRERVDWRPFIFGSIVGAVPWIAIGFQLVRTAVATGGEVPTFVFAIYVSLLVLFSSFAVNMVLQYRRAGRWRDPAFAERAYIVLSLVAKSALAWQVYAGALAG